jgi:type II secretory pathway pseudopilin PulG
MVAMKSRAFTLVEVVIVCGILACLMAIVLPAFTSSKSRAQEVVCVSNLRQLGLADELYKNDYNDYPGFAFPAFNGYLGGAKLRCPMKSDAQSYNFRAYANLGSFTMTSKYPELQKYFDDMKDCFNLRGSDYPLIADKNHLPPILRSDDLLPGPVIVYRVSGSVQILPKQKYLRILDVQEGLAPANTIPCAADAQLGNL